MKKRFNKLMIPTIIIALTFALPLMAGASGGGFSVTPIIPENQNPENTGVFDLLVYPGQTQEILIDINNANEEEITVEITLISPGTNSNGIIDYGTTGIIDEAAVSPFHEIASFNFDRYLTIPAMTTATVPVQFTIPEEGFDGVILGAIHVVRGITDDDFEEADMIVNRFAHVMPVLLRQSTERVAPDFMLGEVDVQLVNHRATVVAYVRNPQPRFSIGASVSTYIYTAEGEPRFSITGRDVDFAPSSVFPSSLTDDAGIGIQPGNYIARVRVEYNEQIWEFEEEFTVTAQAAEIVNQAAVNQQHIPEVAGATGIFDAIPIWFLIATGAGLAVLLPIIITLFKRSKNKNRRQMRELAAIMQSTMRHSRQH